MKSMGSGWENLKIQLALKGLRKGKVLPVVAEMYGTADPIAVTV